MDYDIEILSTDYVPTLEEASKVGTQLRTQGDELQATESRIVDAVLGLLALRDKRDRLVQSRAVGEALLAPIRKLPAKILEEIFTLSLPPPDIDFLEYFLRNPSNPSFFKGQCPQNARGHLERVCRRWRTIIHGSPHLYSFLCWANWPPEELECAKMWIHRSNPCLLDIVMDAVHMYSEEYGKAVTELLRREVPRLHLFAERIYSSNKQSSMFPVGEHTEALNMRAVCIVHMTSSDLKMGSVHAPNLHTLSLHNADSALKVFASTPLLALRRLAITLATSPSASYLHCLVGCPNLEFLEWNEHYIKGINPFALPRPVQVRLSSLKKFKFGTYEPENCLDFLRCLHLPSLQSLEIHTIPPAFQSGELNPLVPLLSSLLGKGRPPLKHLEILNGIVSGPGIKELLSRLDDLDTICISTGVLDHTLFDALKPQDRLSALICPRLTNLTIDRCQLVLSDLVDMIRLRTRSDAEGQLPGYLSTVNVTHRADKPEDVQVLAQLQKTHSATLTLDISNGR